MTVSEPLRPVRAEAARAAESLRNLIARGQVGGPWSDVQVRSFERECSEFIGQFGEMFAGLVTELGRAEETNRLLEEDNTRLLNESVEVTDRLADARAELERVTRERREMHRRAQKAESELAGQPSLNALTEALIALKQAKQDRHRLRNDYTFKVKECNRLRDKAKAAEAGLVAAREALQQIAALHQVGPNSVVTIGDAGDASRIARAALAASLPEGQETT